MSDRDEKGMSRLEEFVAFGGLVVAIAALLTTSYGFEVVLAYVCLAFWRVQVHNNE